MDTRHLYLVQQTTHYITNSSRKAYLTGGSLRNILLGELYIDEDMSPLEKPPH